MGKWKWYCSNCNFSSTKERNINEHKKNCKPDSNIKIKTDNKSKLKLIVFMIDDKCLDDYFNSMRNFFYEINIYYLNKNRYNLKKYTNFIKENKNDNTIFILVYGDMMYKDDYGKLFDNCKLFYLNIEQLTRKQYLKYILKKKIKLLDFSYENVNILNKLNKKCMYLPYQFNKDEIFNYDKIYDVAIIGKLNNRRNKIYNLLKKKNVNIINIIGWGKDRDEKLFRSKIILNIHYSEEYNIFEELRCNRCIFNRMIVITEDSKNIDNFIFRNNIVVSKYNEIKNKTIEIINNYEEYYNNLFYNYNISEINNYLIKFYDCSIFNKKI